MNDSSEQADRPVRRVFVSYDHATGLDLAIALKHSLQTLGVDAWVWQEDYPSQYPFETISEQILNADLVCFLCTAGTGSSAGQRYELATAFGLGKFNQIWVLAPDRSHTPVALAGYFQHPISLETVGDVVTGFLDRLESGTGSPRVVMATLGDAAIATERTPPPLSVDQLSRRTL